MKRNTRKAIIIVVSLAVVFCLAYFSDPIFRTLTYTYFSDDPNDYPDIVNRKPLRYLEDEPEAEYVLVRGYGDRRDCIIDFSLLYENRDVFIVTNSKSIYFTTADGHFALYKDGERIDGELYGAETIRIAYGTLERAFIPMSSEQWAALIHE